MPENDRVNHELAHQIEKEENEMVVDQDNGIHNLNHNQEK
jgi:hypothetical protein